MPPVPSRGQSRHIRATTHNDTAHSTTVHPHTAQSHTSTTDPIALSKHKDLYEGSEQDLGYTPYFLRRVVRDDQEERAAMGITPKDYGNKWKACFRVITGNAPSCGPADHDKAREFWSRVKQAIAKGGWSPGEWNQLHKLERTWRKRMQGEDARFEAVGTYRGGLDGEQRRRVAVATMIQNVRELGR